MIITKRHISRRAVLKGMGVTMALPFLDAMIPVTAFARKGGSAAAGADATRLVAIEMVHGAAGCNELGAKMNMWSPAETGKAFDLAPTALKSLDAYREYLTIISNTDVRQAEPTTPKEIGGDHFAGPERTVRRPAYCSRENMKAAMPTQSHQ